MESKNKESELSAGEQHPSPSERQDSNQIEQLTTQEASTARAQKSGGPRTQQGKERSKHNASKFGILSKVVVLEGESRAEFAGLLNGLSNYFQPQGAFEEIQTEKLAALYWRQRRLIIAEGKADIGNGGDFLGLTKPPEWDLLLRYEATLDRAIDRTLAQLERYQRMRLGHPVPPPINVNLILVVTKNHSRAVSSKD
jgi:hypothetical protein